MPFVADNPYQSLRPLPDGKYWVTEHELVFRSERHQCLVQVPARYVTDGASIPRLLWPFVGHPFGNYHPAALVHDRIYETHTVLVGGRERPAPRSLADSLLEEACRDLDIDWWPRVGICRGVQVGGWVAWGNGQERRQTRQALAPAMEG
jgi:hypothetical protein